MYKGEIHDLPFYLDEKGCCNDYETKSHSTRRDLAKTLLLFNSIKNRHVYTIYYIYILLTISRILRPVLSTNHVETAVAITWVVQCYCSWLDVYVYNYCKTILKNSRKIYKWVVVGRLTWIAPSPHVATLLLEIPV